MKLDEGPFILMSILHMLFSPKKQLIEFFMDHVETDTYTHI